MPPRVTLAALPSNGQCAVSVLIIAELAWGHSWSRYLKPDFSGLALTPCRRCHGRDLLIDYLYIIDIYVLVLVALFKFFQMQLVYYFINTIYDCFIFSVYKELLSVREHDPPRVRSVDGVQPIRRFH